MIKETESISKTITHTIECTENQYWEITYEYRNEKLMSINISFHQDSKISYNESFIISSWVVEGDMGLVLAKLVYYFKTNQFLDMFPNLIFKDPIRGR